MSDHAHSYRERTRAKLQEIVADAAREAPLFIPLEMREIGATAEAQLHIRWRADPRLPDPDECEQAILDLIYHHRLIRAEDIVASLEERFSRTTIYARLKKLKRRGLIISHRKAPRGYSLCPKLRSMADLNTA